MLFTPAAHEPLAGDPWDADRARQAITEIATETEDAFDDGWWTHPLDGSDAVRFHSVYLGGAGTIDALRRLAGQGEIELRRDYRSYLERSLANESDFPGDDSERSFWMGEASIRLALQRLAPTAANLERLDELIAANATDERCELMWGSPGSILAARELELDAETAVEWLRDQRDQDGLWTQRLYGTVARFLGPVHGYAGCALAAELPDDSISEPLRLHAVFEDGRLNWPARAESRLDAASDGQIRVQFCHGAPGIVATLGSRIDEDLAVAGAELTWQAGPLRKGANLCHGTAGNGYAFLVLFERTGDELWLERARSFAMHAIGQTERARAEYGRGRFSLWTGDPGTALYLADCIAAEARLPLP